MYMKTYYLYYLIDPNTNVVRYIGISYHPKIRLKEHLRGAKKKKTHKDKWLFRLLENNQEPILKIISESLNKKDILNKEINAISNFDNLTNSTTGGEYFTFSPEIIEKLKIKEKIILIIIINGLLNKKIGSH